MGQQASFYSPTRALGVMWGHARENGIWWATRSRRRLMLRGHDALYVAAGRLRVRIMKPWIR
jgi:hypothetical protein